MGTSVAPTLQSPATVDLFETRSPNRRESRRRPPRADARWSGAEGQRRDKVNGSVVRNAGTHDVCASSECFGCGDEPPGGGQAARAIRTAALGDDRSSSTGGLSTEWSPPALQSSLGAGRVHLGGGFPLRCVQRLSPPAVATRRCPWQGSRDTSGQSDPVLSYWGPRPATLRRPRRIQTELSHDVLNPAHVPL